MLFKFWEKRTLQVEVTTACNLDCEICLRRNLNIPPRFLPFDEFRKIIDFRGFRYVGLHGWGEPLLNPDIFRMISYAESKGFITNLTTNGTLLEKHTDDILRSGLREIAFGIYTRELFERILPQVEGFIREKRKRGARIPKTYLDITLHERNGKDIASLIKLAREIDVDAVIVHRLFDVYGAGDGKPFPEEEGLFRELRELSRNLGLELYLPPKHTFPCRIVRRSIFVRVDGKVTPCTYLLEEELGDALEDGIPRILSSEKYKRFVKGMREHPICGRCRW